MHTLYHFTYSGMKNNQLVFKKRMLSLSDTESDTERFEKFNIYNEYPTTFKEHIDKLKDLEYSKSHSLKKKKIICFIVVQHMGKYQVLS